MRPIPRLILGVKLARYLRELRDAQIEERGS